MNYIPYYLKVYEADSLYITNNFQQSFQILDSLFKKFEPADMSSYGEYGIYLGSAVESGNVDNIKEKVIYSKLNFGDFFSSHKNANEIYKKVIEASKLTKVEIENLDRQYEEKMNNEVRKTFVQMYKDDQNYRQGNPDIIKMKEIDDSNRLKLNQIFKKYGFPTGKLIGGTNCGNLKDGIGQIRTSLFIIHQSDSVRAKYIPIYYKALVSGNVDPEEYSGIVDRDLNIKGQKQLYGTYSCGNVDEICPLVNTKKIDSIRKSIGLPHIKYRTWRLKQIKNN